MAAVRHIGFLKNAVFVMYPCRHPILLPHTKFRWNQTIGQWVMAKKSDFQDGGLAMLNFKNFQFLFPWLSSGSIPDVVYQISSKSYDFWLSYGDLTIFKMAAISHLGFKKLQFLSCSPCRHALLLPHTKFRWNRTIGRWVIAKKAIFKMAAAAILNSKNFNFWSRDCNLVQYLM